MIAYDRLSTIIPADLALANKALAVSLGQISGAPNMQLPTLANTVSAVNTNYGLPAINSQTQPLTNANKTYLLTTVGYGTGPCGSITTMDELGTVAGWVVSGNLTVTTQQLSTMNTTALQGGYQNIINAMNGSYDYHVPNPAYPPTLPEYLGWDCIVPGGLGAGTYGTYASQADARNAAISAIITACQGECANLVATYPTQTSKMNSAFGNISQQMGNEQDIQYRAGLDFGNFFANLQSNSQTAIFSFAQSLPGYGQNIEKQGSAQFLESIANTQSEGGQAMIATMRQGRTQSAINAAGILSASDIPLIPNPPLQQANLLPSTYTVAQAVGQIKY